MSAQLLKSDPKGGRNLVMNVQQRSGVSSCARIQGLCPIHRPTCPPPSSKHPSLHPPCPKQRRQLGATEPSLCRAVRPRLCLPSSAVPVCFSQQAAVEAAVLQTPLTAPGLSPASSSQGHTEDQLVQPVSRVGVGTSQVKFSSHVYNIYARRGIADKYPVTQLCRVHSNPIGAAAVSCQSPQSPRETTP